MMMSIPRSALVLGVSGLFPFIACTGAIWSNIGWVQAEGLAFLIGYSAVILSFLGAIHWGRALADDVLIRWPTLMWSVTPSLIAWLTLRMQPVSALVVLAITFAVAFWVDYRAVVYRHFFPEWYLLLRKVLTLGVLACLALSLMHLLALFQI